MTKIGLEIHCQLTKLESKLFCSCKANYREFEPNQNICPVCMGLPGSLPVSYTHLTLPTTPYV